MLFPFKTNVNSSILVWSPPSQGVGSNELKILGSGLHQVNSHMMFDQCKLLFSLNYIAYSLQHPQSWYLSCCINLIILEYIVFIFIKIYCENIYIGCITWQWFLMKWTINQWMCISVSLVNSYNLQIYVSVSYSYLQETLICIHSGLFVPYFTNFTQK